MDLWEGYRYFSLEFASEDSTLLRLTLSAKVDGRCVRSKELSSALLIGQELTFKSYSRVRLRGMVIL